MIFSGLRSLWIINFSCNSETAYTSYFKITLASSSGRIKSLAVRRSLKSPALTGSMTKQKCFSLSPAQISLVKYSLQLTLSRHSFSIKILALDCLSSLIFLIATVSPVFCITPKYTDPKEPDPSSQTSLTFYSLPSSPIVIVSLISVFTFTSSGVGGVIEKVTSKTKSELPQKSPPAMGPLKLNSMCYSSEIT